MKKLHGQFFTITDPFNHPSFLAWSERAKLKESIVLEPFAGSNNIIKMLGIENFASFDIEPKSKDVSYKNTLQSFPEGYSVCITNPHILPKILPRGGGSPSLLPNMMIFTNMLWKNV